MPKQPAMSTRPAQRISTCPCNTMLPFTAKPPFPMFMFTSMDTVPRPVASITPCCPIDIASAWTCVDVSDPEFTSMFPPLLTNIPAFNVFMLDSFKIKLSFATTIPLYST